MYSTLFDLHLYIMAHNTYYIILSENLLFQSDYTLCKGSTRDGVTLALFVCWNGCLQRTFCITCGGSSVVFCKRSINA